MPQRFLQPAQRLKQVIAEAMDWLMSHPEDAAQMGVNGQRAVAKTYDWPGEAAKLLALYDRFID